MDNTEIAKFLWASISSGVIGNAAYDGIKTTLGIAFDRLAGHTKAQKRAEFDAAVFAILETNQKIRNILSSLASGTSINISQHHSGTGDNVAGDKITNNNHISPQQNTIHKSTKFGLTTTRVISPNGVTISETTSAGE